jgi:DNA-binding NarL/FixJ family response regulator
MSTEDLIIEHLKNGLTQPEVANQISMSLSSVEKYLKAIRKKHDAKTMFHLGFILAKK